MAATSVQHCNCPRCNGVGRSVGAMNYAETKVWDKSGSFSGSGVGIGTGGIGVGMGGGTYSEHGQIASKRAATFNEPQPFSLPILPVVGLMIFAGLAYKISPDVLSNLFLSDGNGNSNYVEALMPIAKVAVGIGSAFLIGMGIFKFVKMSNEEVRLNTEVYPKRLARYHELQYCANCHTLFDTRGNAANADELGFDAMMRIDAVPVRAA